MLEVTQTLQLGEIHITASAHMVSFHTLVLNSGP